MKCAQADGHLCTCSEEKPEHKGRRSGWRRKQWDMHAHLCGALVSHWDEPSLTIELKDDLPDATGVWIANRDKLHKECVAGLQLELRLLPQLHWVEEELRRQLAHIAEDEAKLLPVVEDLGVERVGKDVDRLDVLRSVLRLEHLSRRVKVVCIQTCALRVQRRDVEVERG